MSISDLTLDVLKSAWARGEKMGVFQALLAGYKLFLANGSAALPKQTPTATNA